LIRPDSGKNGAGVTAGFTVEGLDTVRRKSNFSIFK